MCGIAGVVAGDKNEKVSAEWVHRMCETIVHRGPDDEGIYAQGPAGLGIRRLSIIDVAGGHQPIHNEEQTIWVVLNGEIYNFPELRAELENRGHFFYTQSDTEVIVHLYEELGANCVTRLRGMFAFALFDERQQKLVLARDRLGKKPLHYALHQNRLLFGSEIKTILAVAPELAEVDPNGILHYFYFGYILDPLTAFKSIRKLPPGHLLEFSGGQMAIRPYWELPAYGTQQPESEEEVLEDFEKRLTEAVRIRLISDVPLGALLSGGVDSSTVVALMARVSNSPVKTFSIGFGREEFNEAAYARRVAQEFGTEHHEFIVEPRVNETLLKLTCSMEEPFGDSSMVPTYHVSAIARQHVTVALAGDGGDELFGGYERYERHLNRRGAGALPKWVGNVYRRWIFPVLPEATRGRRYLYNITLSDLDRYLDSIAHLPTEGRERALFSREFLALADRLESPFAAFRQCLSSGTAPDPLSQLLLLDTKTYLPGDILTKVDRMSMATSLEVRAPLLDHVLVEWAVSLPASLKARIGQPKYLLRKLARRVGVPSEVLDRPKQGFAMPLVHWFRQELKRDLIQILLEPRTLQRGYFNARAVETMLRDHWSGRRDRSYQIWLLLVFELWHRNFLESLGRTPSVAGNQGAVAQTMANT